eukprot:CAMPEP_0197591574 /NCGR_PEP_ID=MMETSP1326-20131121/13788_1 /TAXON_ID=1155430 /ORGANISM="Genus nov. species nov., Strain RCC2288" /LENGTH=221 /DNA_ID=CAMNT_0043157095 /DNA_START=63 /DNA_END=728 /DNA_ORIENTATION=-
MSALACSCVAAQAAAWRRPARASVEGGEQQQRRQAPRPGSRRHVMRGSALHVATNAVEEGEQSTQPGGRSRRRDFLAAQLIAFATATQAAMPADVWAAVEGVLPKDYTDKARAVVNTLTASLEFEAVGKPSDADRFRKADPAKEAIKEFVKDWASSPMVQGERAHDDIVVALRELGAFYKANGSRTKMTPEVRNKILAKLYDAREILPKAEKTLAERLIGL